MSGIDTPAKVPQVQAQADNLTMEVNKLYESANQLMTRMGNAGVMLPTEQPKSLNAAPESPPPLVPLARQLYDNANTVRSTYRLIDDILTHLEV